MTQCTIHMVVGGLPANTPGQWIDSLFILDRADAFTFSADLCRLQPSGEFSLYRVGAKVLEPFTAELGLALLLDSAEPPFAPTTGGLEVRVEGDAGFADGQVVRLVDPIVRRFANSDLVPLKVARELAEQRGKCALQRDLHRKLWNVPRAE